MTNKEAIYRIREHIELHKEKEPRAVLITEALEMAIKALEQNPCSNCIEFKRYAKEMGFEIKQEPCEDAISRARVLSMAIFKQYNAKQAGSLTQDEIIKDWDDMIDFVETLPTVQPKGKVGEWCKQNDDYFDWYECSECGYGSEGEMQYCSEYDVRTNYCPNCGAKMKGSK